MNKLGDSWVLDGNRGRGVLRRVEEVVLGPHRDVLVMKVCNPNI